MDVSRAIEEEEPGTGKRVIGFPGNFEDANVIVPGFELDEDLDVLDGNAVVLGISYGRGRVVGLLGFGCL